MRKPRSREPLEERFWKYVHATDGCWFWIGAKLKTGYGAIGRGGRGEGTVRANRVAYELCVGPIPEGKMVLHSCDNRACVNPAHLFLGDAKSNYEDAYDKGLVDRYAVRKVTTRETCAKGGCIGGKRVRIK